MVAPGVNMLQAPSVDIISGDKTDQLIDTPSLPQWHHCHYSANPLYYRPHKKGTVYVTPPDPHLLLVCDLHTGICYMRGHVRGCVFMYLSLMACFKISAL